MAKSVTIRKIPDETIEAIEKLASIEGMSREAYLLRLLSEHAGRHADKIVKHDAILGFVKLDFPGLDGDELCTQCGEAFHDQGDGSQYAGLTYGGTATVVCGLCAMDF